MYDIVTIGSATRDVFMRARDLVLIKDPRFKTGAGECLALGSKVEVSEILYTVGGSAANTAVTFARQGFHTACIAKVGNDLRGEEIIRQLGEENIDTHFITKHPKLMTAYSAVLSAPSGERSILVFRGAGETLAPEDIPRQALRTKWLYITHLGGKSAKVFAWLIRNAASRGIKIAVNPGSTQLRMAEAKLKPLLNHIDVFILNREEASYLTHIPYAKPNEVFKKLDVWVKGIVVMTDGPQGLTVSDGKTRWHAGVLKERKLVDRTGAGDAFGSGFVAGFMKKKSVSYAIQYGSANATSKIESMGAQPGLLYKKESILRWGKLKIKTGAIG